MHSCVQAPLAVRDHLGAVRLYAARLWSFTDQAIVRQGDDGSEVAGTEFLATLTFEVGKGR